MRTAITALAAAFFTLLAVALANPVSAIHRQTVLGGKSFRDAFKIYSGREKIPIRESCTAAVSPDDIKGVNSFEIVERASLRRFEYLVPLELKVVEGNYRLLSLKDAQGKFIFSEHARAFARAETAYAGKIMPALLSTKDLCLIANFDTMPAAETEPYSRSRKIVDARTKAGLTTKVIQLRNTL